jgi:hypothetical protein
MKWAAWLVLLSGCVTTHGTAPAPVETKAEPAVAAPADDDTTAAAASPVAAAQARVTEALARLPSCRPGADVGHLVVRPTVCTKMFCAAECCNRCGWEATYETMAGSLPAERARVQAVLGLPDGALECEVAAWGRALSGQSIALDAPSCVVR